MWGLLVDDDLDSKLPDPEPYVPAGLTGNAPADLQAETARLAGEWGLGKLNEISDEQAREDLGRLSAQMMTIVAASARVADGHRDAVPEDVVAQGTTAAEKFLLRWRGEADPRPRAGDRHLLDLHRGAWAQRLDLHRARRRLHRRRLRRALSSAVGALSGPLHGGAPAYVKPMLEEVTASGDPEGWVRDALDSGKRLMGFGHRVYRAEDPRSRILKRTAKELGSPQIEIAEALEQAAREELRRASRTRPRDQRRVLLGGRPRHRGDPAQLVPAMFACSRVAGWSAHILEQKRTGRLFRPSARYVGPG